jgi:hypothetical protein
MRPSRRTLLGMAAGVLARPSAAAPASRARLGINLAPPDDYGGELPFVDVFRLSRDWISQREGSGWGKGPALALDERGWIKRLEPHCYAEALVLGGIPGHVPGGDYTILYDGEGRVGCQLGATVIGSSHGRVTLKVAPETEGVFIRLEATSATNHVRNVRVLRPGHEQSYRSNPWNPRFLERWRGVAALRFMDFQRTNNSKLRRWVDRPTIDSASYVGGVPIELLVDLSNRLDADPWLCIPHAADDDFVQRFATLVRDRLSPRRTVYLEYSNEVWNGMFHQHQHAVTQGRQRNLDPDDFGACMRWTALRSTEVFRIWERVFGGKQRLCRVLPSWSDNPEASATVASFRDAGRSADALAIAPYLNLAVPPEGEPPLASTVAAWTVDQLFEHLEGVVLPRVIANIKATRAIAARSGLRLVAYEGGQHLLGIQGAENDETLAKLFHLANGHRRMGELYKRYLTAWAEAGGDLFCHFNSVAPWSKWGSWGLLQYHDDPPRGSPKFLATMRWGRAQGQPLTVPE